MAKDIPISSVENLQQELDSIPSSGSGTTKNGNAVDLGGELNSNTEVERINGDAKLVLGLSTANAILYYQNLIAQITNALWADGNFAMLQSLGPGGLAANLYVEKDGYAKAGNNGSGTFKGLRYKDASSVSAIDWLTDPNEGLLIPHQDRIKALAAEQGWGSVNNAVVLNEYYVAKTGLDTNNGSIATPFLTIQAAHDAASAGIRSNIYIDEGVYADALAISKPVQLIGIKGSGRFDVLTELTAQPVATGETVIYSNLKLPSVTPNATTYDIFLDCSFSGGTMRGKYYNCLATGAVAAFTDVNNEWHNCVFEGNFDPSRGKIYNTIIEGNVIHDGVADVSLYSTTIKGTFTQNGSTLNLYNSHIEGALGGTAVNIIPHDKASTILYDDSITQIGQTNLQTVVALNVANIINYAGHAASDGTDHSDVGFNNAHRLSDGSGHAAVQLNSAKRTYPSQDETKLSTIQENAQVHIPPVHLADYADKTARNADQANQIIGHPYKTLDDESWRYLRVKTGSDSDYDGGGVAEYPVILTCSGFKDVPLLELVNQKLARDRNYIIRSVKAEVKSAPSGGDCVITVSVASTVIATITIADGNLTQTGTPAISNDSWNDGDLLEIHVTSANGAIYPQVEIMTTY